LGKRDLQGRTALGAGSKGWGELWKMIAVICCNIYIYMCMYVYVSVYIYIHMYMSIRIYIYMCHCVYDGYGGKHMSLKILGR
jgi:hypothetical protein